MSRLVVLLPSVFCFVFFGCSTGFNRTEMAKELRSGPYEILVEQSKGEVRAEDISGALALRPQLRFPMKLAVRLAPGKSPSWRWSGEDKERLEIWGDKLREEGIASDVFFLSDIVVKDETLAGLRLAAARHGADALLIVQAAADLDKYLNPSSILYLSIVGYYFVPGSHADGLMIVRGAMYDVGNEYLYLTAEAEAEQTSWGPGAFVSNKKVLEKAKDKALKRFGEELVQRMRALK